MGQIIKENRYQKKELKSTLGINKSWQVNKTNTNNDTKDKKKCKYKICISK